jgi:hypothetical protein
MKITKKCVFASRMGLALVGIFLLGQANATVYVLSGDMDVFQALTNPGNVGNGTGTIAGDYDDVTNSLNYTITWMDLTSDVNNMHFHVAPVGVSGGVDLGIPSPWSSPQVGSATLTDTQETNLLSGNWYVNVHTLDFGGGEIRGQVIVNPVPIPAAAWLFGSGLLCLFGLVRRKHSVYSPFKE